jgi:hypothetical protein
VYQTLLADASFFRFLIECDRDLAAEAQKGGCLFCADVLHQANYHRRPRGEPCGLDEEGLGLRFSFCCAREGCRRRHTPPSLRFLGRRVYLAAVVVLVSAMREGPTPTRLAKLEELVGVCPRTVRRWQRWWREEFPRTRAWQVLRGRCAAPVIDERGLPGSALERFVGTVREKLVAFLRSLAP